MSFLLRATLVIGALSYLAAMRGRPEPTVGAPDAGSMPAAMDAASKGLNPLAAGASVSAAWNALPADARQRLAREAVTELGRRVGPAPTSRDTLADADRRTAWRGAEGR